MTNEREKLTLEKLIVAATLERHCLLVNNRSWIDTYAQWAQGGQGIPLPEMTAVLDSIKRELVQYLGEGWEANLGEYFLQ